jgi:hypothetical protein
MNLESGRSTTLSGVIIRHHVMDQKALVSCYTVLYCTVYSALLHEIRRQNPDAKHECLVSMIYRATYSIHENSLPIDPRAFRAGEHGHYRGNLVGTTNAFQRMEILIKLDLLFRFSRTE